MLEFLLFLAGISTKVNSKMVNMRDMEFFIGLMEENMRVDSRMGKNMESANGPQSTVKFLLVNGKMVKKMDKVYSHIQMEQNMMVNG